MSGLTIMQASQRGDWKCGSGIYDTGKIARVENAGVENAGVDSRGGKCRSKSYGTPTRDYIKKTSSSLDLYLFFWLNKVRLVRTEQTAQTVSPYIQGCGVAESPWVRVLARSLSRTRSLPQRVGLRLQEPSQLVLLCLTPMGAQSTDF